VNTQRAGALAGAASATEQIATASSTSLGTWFATSTQPSPRLGLGFIFLTMLPVSGEGFLRARCLPASLLLEGQEIVPPLVYLIARRRIAMPLFLLLTALASILCHDPL
jgi:hypothetical protein